MQFFLKKVIKKGFVLYAFWILATIVNVSNVDSDLFICLI